MEHSVCIFEICYALRTFYRLRISRLRDRERSIIPWTKEKTIAARTLLPSVRWHQLASKSSREWPNHCSLVSREKRVCISMCIYLRVARFATQLLEPIEAKTNCYSAFFYRQTRWLTYFLQNRILCRSPFVSRSSGRCRCSFD